MKLHLSSLCLLVGFGVTGFAQGRYVPLGSGRIAATPPGGSLGLQAIGSTADISLIRLSSDEKRLAYLADAEQDGLFELYSLKPPGKHVVKLSQPFAPGRAGVADFVITPDGRTVVYLADHAARSKNELYSVPIGGGPVVKIERPRVLGAIVLNTYRLTLDSKGVVFVDRDTGPLDLFVSPLDGGATTKLSRSDGQVSAASIRLSPDGQRVVYQAPTNQSPDIRVLSARLDGSGEPVLVGTGDESFGPAPCEVSLDSTRVVYGGVSGEDNLFSAPIDGSAAPVQLNGALPAGGRVDVWQLSPDGTHVVYQSNEENGITFQVHSVPVDGSAPAVLLSDATGSEYILDFQSSPSGSVAFLTNPIAPQRFELQSAPISGSAVPDVVSLPAENLSLTFANLSFSWGPLMRIIPDGGTRVFYAASDPSGHTSLSTAAIDGSDTPIRIAELAPDAWIRKYFILLPRDGRTADLDLDPIQQRAVYIEAKFVFLGAGTTKLVSAPLDGSSPAVELSGPRAAGATGPSMFVTSPRKGLVYYTADSLEAGVFELYSVRTDGSEAPRRMVDL